MINQSSGLKKKFEAIHLTKEKVMIMSLDIENMDLLILIKLIKKMLEFYSRKFLTEEKGKVDLGMQLG
eukprot:4626855-Ditylum_brightwellii.AAC.1